MDQHAYQIDEQKLMAYNTFIKDNYTKYTIQKLHYKTKQNLNSFFPK